MEDDLAESNVILKFLAITDELTQIGNRRLFDESLVTEWARMRRLQRPLCVIMCDIDHFKLFNDQYGHQAGDDCLFKVAQAINAAVHR